MSEWRGVKCSEVNWFLFTPTSRAGHALRRLCMEVSNPTVWTGDRGEWAHLTLGQLADMGVKAWNRQHGIGKTATEAIKATIDAAAAGQDVCRAPDAYLPSDAYVPPNP